MNAKTTIAGLSRADQASIRAYAFLQVGEYASSSKQAEIALQADPERLACLCLAALAYLGQGHFGKAELYAQKAHNLRPKSPDTSFILGLCKLSTGSLASAESLFDSAVEKAEKRWDIITDFAAILIRSQKFDKALELLDRLPEEHQQHPKALLSRKCAEERIWNDNLERQIFRAPIPLPEHQASTYIVLGRSHLDNGYYSLAIEEFSRALDVNPNNEEAKCLYSEAYILKDDDFKAWCRDYRRRLSNPIFSFFTILLPLAAVAYPGFIYAGQKAYAVPAVMAVACLIYIIFVLYFRAKGKIKYSIQHFDNLVATYNLTPQGRRKVFNQEDSAVNAIQEHDDRIKNQLDERSRHFKNVSMTFSWLSILMLMLMGFAILALKSPVRVFDDTMLKVAEGAAFVLCIIFSLIAFNFRKKSRNILQRM